MQREKFHLSQQNVLQPKVFKIISNVLKENEKKLCAFEK